jgi:3-phosphoshikimate 1-carboxyvinyltransferase
MTELRIRPATGLRGWVRVPGDKSISHRALLLGALAQGDSHVSGFLPSGDCLATVHCLLALGIAVDETDGTTLTIHGRGLHGLLPPSAPLDCQRSGTTMRMLSGLMAGQAFTSVLTGEAQLRRRPMERVAAPLRQMGAHVETTDGHAPLTVRGGRLHGIDLSLPIASAQVKSALLLAGLYADGPTVLHEPGPARDHTERMLRAMIVPRLAPGGAAGPLTRGDGAWALDPAQIDHLRPLDIVVPGDFSSAAFLLGAGTLVLGSELTVSGVGINPTRTGLLDVLGDMGADIDVRNESEQGGEPVADLSVRPGALHGAQVEGDRVVRMIDEFPILAVAATQAQGETSVRDAAELRVKETDRIATVVTELRKLGAQIEPCEDGFVVSGPTPLRGTVVDSHGDHRLAMALAVAGLVAEGQTTVRDTEWIADSFPGFEELLSSLRA